MNKVAFITGVTGFIGGELARHISCSGEFKKIYLLIRPLSGLSAEERLKVLLARWRKVFNHQPAEQLLTVVSGEISQFDSFLIPQDTTHVFHSAASTRFDDSLSYARKMNLEATQNLLLKCRSLDHFELFVHFSTAFVSGQLEGVIKEEDRPSRFFNNYEKSKYEAEQAVRCAGVPYVILRPSIVVGDSKTGFTQHYRIFYSMLRIWMKGQIPRAPMHRQASVDIVPVDFVCAVAQLLCRNERAFNDSYHVCAGPERLVDPGTILQYAVDVFKISMPPVSPVWVVHILNFPLFRPFLPRALGQYLQKMVGHFPYMSPRRRWYDMSRTKKYLQKEGVECPKLSDYGEVLFLYCKQSNWGRNLEGLEYV